MIVSAGRYIIMVISIIIIAIIDLTVLVQVKKSRLEKTYKIIIVGVVILVSILIGYEINRVHYMF